MTTAEFYRKVDGSLDEVLERIPDEKRLVRYLSALPRERCLEDMTEGVKAADAPRVFRAVHTLKGLCLNLGICSPLPLCERICNALRGTSSPDCLASIGGDVAHLECKLRELYALIEALDARL